MTLKDFIIEKVYEQCYNNSTSDMYQLMMNIEQFKDEHKLEKYSIIKDGGSNRDVVRWYILHDVGGWSGYIWYDKIIEEWREQKLNELGL